MEKRNAIINRILIILSITFVLIDWRIGNVAISDTLLLVVVLLLLIEGSFTISGKQLLISTGVLSLILMNILFNILFNDNFILSNGIKGLAKIMYYMIIIMALYNFIKKKKLEEDFLRILGITATVVCIIGIYITIAIYLKGILPYDFFWKFTRTDMYSYTYRGWGRTIIRSRSIFSEPAHFGFYLNSILAIFYFNKYKYNFNKKQDLLFTITLITTFSFSAIAVMGVIKILYYLNFKNFYNLFTNKRNILGLIVLVIVIFAMRETIEKTIVIRIQEILKGSDRSATARMSGSWIYLNKDNPFLGNGIGNTPEIFNIYAYIFSDLGFISFLISISLSIIMLLLNFKLGLFFIVQNFQKGGYLGAGYWIFILIIAIYIGEFKNIDVESVSVDNLCN